MSQQHQSNGGVIGEAPEATFPQEFTVGGGGFTDSTYGAWFTSGHFGVSQGNGNVLLPGSYNKFTVRRTETGAYGLWLLASMPVNSLMIDTTWQVVAGVRVYFPAGGTVGESVSWTLDDAAEVIGDWNIEQHNCFISWISSPINNSGESTTPAVTSPLFFDNQDTAFIEKAVHVATSTVPTVGQTYVVTSTTGYGYPHIRFHGQKADTPTTKSSSGVFQLGSSPLQLGGSSYGAGGFLYRATVNGVDYAFHRFTDDGTLVLPFATELEILLVGGGGGSSANAGGGGGGGAVIEAIGQATANVPFTVTVGAGGLPSNQGASTYSDTYGGPGQTSAFGPVNATGGGGGAGYSGLAGGAGANGSGGGGYGPLNNGGAGTAPTLPSGWTGTVHAGNTGSGASGAQGGGGGAGAGVGFTWPNHSMHGGDGIEINFDGTSYFWGGGGGAGSWQLAPGNGGKGGGGGGGSNNVGKGVGGIGGITNGGDGNDVASRPGTGHGGPGTGGGGGGSAFYGHAGASGSFGGSGICIVRYRI
jgi:hypothetical protein